MLYIYHLPIIYLIKIIFKEHEKHHNQIIIFRI